MDESKAPPGTHFRSGESIGVILWYWCVDGNPGGQRSRQVSIVGGGKKSNCRLKDHRGEPIEHSEKVSPLGMVTT